MLGYVQYTILLRIHPELVLHITVKRCIIYK